jgi:predicted Zn-dependent protease
LEQSNASPAYHSGEASEHFQAAENSTKFRYKSGISGKLTLERVNEITWKLTNGELINVPTSHGQWAGYRVSKAGAWVMTLE